MLSICVSMQEDPTTQKHSWPDRSTCDVAASPLAIVMVKLTATISTAVCSLWRRDHWILDDSGGKSAEMPSS